MLAAVALAAAMTVPPEAAEVTSAVVAAAAATLVAAAVSAAMLATVVAAAAVAGAVEALAAKACPRGLRYAFVARTSPSRLGFAHLALVAHATRSRLGFAHTQQSNSKAAAAKGTSAALPPICPSGSGWWKQQCQQRSNSHLARGCVKKHPRRGRLRAAPDGPPNTLGLRTLLVPGGGAGDGAAAAISPISCGINQFNVIDEVNYRRSTEE